MSRKFPILHANEVIDWDIIEPHRKQAYFNHGQTLERLAERGGLSWYEMLCVLSDKSFSDLPLKKGTDESYYKPYVVNLVYKAKLKNSNDVLMAELKEYRSVGTATECREARKRQTPKKPDKKPDKYTELVQHYYCPSCGRYFGQRGIRNAILFNKERYCQGENCGQAIDWTESDAQEEYETSKGAKADAVLREIILSLPTPTNAAAKTMEALGLQVFDADGNMRPLKDVLNDLNKILSTMSANEQNHVFDVLFNLSLPFKVGDIVYKPDIMALGGVVEIKIESIFINESGIYIKCRTVIMHYTFRFSLADFGKSIFPTYEQALAQAMIERGGY